MPLVMLHDAWQSLTKPGFRDRFRQRLGFVNRSTAIDTLWIHAVSSVKCRRRRRSCAKLRSRHAALPIVISTVTATGAQRRQASVQARACSIVTCPTTFPVR
jgi:3-deoxy-D-manno-octulosonic-acid transferase